MLALNKYAASSNLINQPTKSNPSPVNQRLASKRNIGRKKILKLKVWWVSMANGARLRIPIEKCITCERLLEKPITIG
jgi:hypothetical protein